MEKNSNSILANTNHENGCLKYAIKTHLLSPHYKMENMSKYQKYMYRLKKIKLLRKVINFESLCNYTVLEKTTSVVIINRRDKVVSKIIDLHSIRKPQFFNEIESFILLDSFGFSNMPRLINNKISADNKYGVINFDYVPQPLFNLDFSWKKKLIRKISPVIFQLYSQSSVKKINLSTFVLYLPNRDKIEGPYEREIIELINKLSNKFPYEIVTEAFCHGDLGSSNSITDSDKTYLIDWAASRRDSIFTDILNLEIKRYIDNIDSSTFLTNLLKLTPSYPNREFGYDWWPRFYHYLTNYHSIKVSPEYIMVNAIISLAYNARSLDRIIILKGKNTKKTKMQRFVKLLLDNYKDKTLEI